MPAVSLNRQLHAAGTGHATRKGFRENAFLTSQSCKAGQSFYHVYRPLKGR